MYWAVALCDGYAPTIGTIPRTWFAHVLVESCRYSVHWSCYVPMTPTAAHNQHNLWCGERQPQIVPTSCCGDPVPQEALESLSLQHCQLPNATLWQYDGPGRIPAEQAAYTATYTAATTT